MLRSELYMQANWHICMRYRNSVIHYVYVYVHVYVYVYVYV